MDPIMLSGTFATIVGLLSNFKAERSGAALSDFIDWLKEQHQDQIAVRIDSDKKLTQELKVLLAIKHDDLVLKLSAINEQIAHVASRIEGFEPLARYLGPSSPLSPQGLALLTQLVKSEAEYAMQISTDMGTSYLLFGGNLGGKELGISEPRFLNEDIEALEATGLARVEYTPKGARKVVPTRLGYSYVSERDA